MKLVINIEDLNLEKEEVTVIFESEHKLPISWLANEKGYINVNESSTFDRLLIEYFKGQMFSDSFGRIPAESFTLISANGHELIQKEINGRISRVIEDFQKYKKEQEILALKEYDKKKKDRIKALKLELAQLESSVGKNEHSK